MRAGTRANLILLAVALVIAGGMATHWGRGKPHNVIIFVADGLRSQIVTAETAPGLAALRAEGVDFQNSHSLYPTVTTANASAIATGHYFGDTGDFGNSIYVGPDAMGPAGAVTVALEDDTVLFNMNQRYGGNFLGEESLLAAARRAGYQTAAVGKLGPTVIQDVTQRDGQGTIVIDDGTGKESPSGVTATADVIAAIKAAGLPAEAVKRGSNGESGDFRTPGTRVANVDQLAWFADVTTKVILPRFKKTGRPFAMVFWSRDPDGTQHNQGDSLNQLEPGVNGPTALAGIRNASDTLQKLRDALKAQGLDKTTDILVTADHGFSTVSKQSASSPSAKLTYPDVPPGFLPPGFLAVDLSLGLNMPLWKPDGKPVSPKAGERVSGNALVGEDPAHPQIVIGANNGTDLIYLTGPDPKAMARRIVTLLLAQDYTGGVFVNDDLGAIPGALPMSAINLIGSARTPRPSIVVGYVSRLGACGKETCQIIVADTELQQGQGNHGSFGWGDTHNFMAAVGPDFKRGFVDPAPVSNADLAHTAAKVMRIQLAPGGKLTGRVMSEALKGGKDTAFAAKTVRSAKTAAGFETVLNYQEADGRRYFDAAGMPGRVYGVK